ncbi:MAG: prepilin-type N-terminal cleavage/methylation domain-containing protein [Bacilli bacterium]
MKKLNKKGFTLVELLVVIVILVVIMSIAIPSVTSSIERSKQKQKDAKIELIESAAELYADRYKNTFTADSDVTVKELITEGLLTKEEAKDPFNEGRTLCGTVHYDGSTYKWNDTSASQSNCVCITDTQNCENIE